MMNDDAIQGCMMVIAILIVIAVGVFIMFNGGCNRQIVDIQYRFEKAMIKMPDRMVRRPKTTV